MSPTKETSGPPRAMADQHPKPHSETYVAGMIQVIEKLGWGMLSLRALVERLNRAGYRTYTDREWTVTSLRAFTRNYMDGK